MMTFLKRHSMALFATIAISLPASAATTYSTDYTDIWWNPAESGWGVNLIQQYDNIFATLFVYDQDGEAGWYVASNLIGSTSSFSGDLFRTSGPYFGAGTFNPAAVTAPKVGTMTLTFNSPTTGTLSYTVNGVNVVKSIQRQHFKNNVLTGSYLGGLTAQGSACTGVANGAVLIFDNLAVTHTGNAVTMRVDFFNTGGTQSRCTFSGNFTQQGRLGAINGGTFNCTVGTSPANNGTFDMTAIDAGNNGFTATFSGRDQFCTYNGRFGGVRDVL